ncbi:UDP-4-amino-4-deoxy-L-arabinose--oxoglutarate aminotransferase [compost metagenome]
MTKLAILGGDPVLPHPLPAYPSVGRAEQDAVARVVESGILSSFYGTWGDQYMGGPKIRAFEEQWSERFRVKHAVSVNSATSGLFAAMGAIGIQPGDEVIVPPYTMSATVMAPLIYGGIPVFVDIEPETFCLDPEAVRRAITPRTKAILVVNLFGHPAKLHELMAIAQEHGLKLVEDNAQGPLAMEGDQYAGTVGHIGVFSLNYHKHIHTGEGGMCVTNDDELALRLQLIRNHGENAAEVLGLEDLTNLVGFNYRMTELSAAIGIEQLKQVDTHVERRVQLAEALTEGLSDLPGLIPPVVREGCRHVYYVWAARYDESVVGISREQFSQALTAEGFPHFTGYVRPLYRLPLFQKRVAFGAYPFNLTTVQYEAGMCSVTERMWQKEFLGFEPCMYDVQPDQVNRLIEAVRKVYQHREALSAAVGSN